MENLSLTPELLGFQEIDLLKTKCMQALEILMGKAPSDGDVKMDVEREGDRFRIQVMLASLQLHFNLAGVAQSPFVALEIATRQALEKIHLWSERKVL